MVINNLYIMYVSFSLSLSVYMYIIIYIHIMYTYFVIIILRMYSDYKTFEHTSGRTGHGATAASFARM